MYDVNSVRIAGRITAISTKKTKNDKDFMAVAIVTNKKIDNKKTEATFVNVMVFNELLINYVTKLGVGKGYFCIVDGYLTNSRIGNVNTALAVVAKDINIVMKITDDTPNTENAIMEDFDSLDI